MQEIINKMKIKMKTITKLEGKLWINRFPANVIMLQDSLKFSGNDKLGEYEKMLLVAIKREMNQIGIFKKNIYDLENQNVEVLKEQVSSLINALNSDSYRIKLFKELRNSVTLKEVKNQDILIEHFLSYLIVVKNVNFDDLTHTIKQCCDTSSKFDFFDRIYEFSKKEIEYKVLIPFNIENDNGYEDKNDLQNLMNANKNKSISFYFKTNIKEKTKIYEIVKEKKKQSIDDFLNNDYNYYAYIDTSSEGAVAALKEARGILSRYESLLFKHNKKMVFNKYALLMKKELKKYNEKEKYFPTILNAKVKKHFYYKKMNNSLKIDMEIIKDDISDFNQKINNIVRSNYINSNNPWFTIELAINYLTFSKREDKMRRRITHFSEVIENIISTSLGDIKIEETLKSDIKLSLNYLYTIRNRSVHSILEDNSLIGVFNSLSSLINDCIIEHLLNFSSALYKSKTRHNQNFENYSKLLFVNSLKYKRKIYNITDGAEELNNFVHVPFPFREFAKYHLI